MKLKPILIYLCLAVYAYFCYKMLAIAMQYIPYHTDVAFLGIKQDVIGLLHYRVAFFTHVYTSLWVLPAGFVQFNSGILKRYKRLHRISGWIYVVFVLLLVAPSGLVMGCYANGGIYSQISFCLLSLFWFYTTLQAVLFIRRKNYLGHQKWMIRSFALTLSAITLRAWKYIIVYLFHPPPMDTYRMVAWLSWVGNLLIAEIIIIKLYQNEKSRKNSIV
jgi:uncharacterized membrane protein